MFKFIMCFLLVKNFLCDFRFGNGVCIFFLFVLLIGNEILILLGCCCMDVVVDFFFLDNFIYEFFFNLI